MNITPEMVKEAVEKNGVRLVCNSWVVVDADGKVCSACALSHIAMAKGLDVAQYDDSDDTEYVRKDLSRQLGLPLGYVTAFTYGFDGFHEIDLPTKSESEYYMEELLIGYKDGKACRKLLYP